MGSWTQALPGRQSLEATKVLVAREKGGQARAQNRRLASSRIGTHPAPGGTEFSARAWDRGPDPSADRGQCPGFAQGGEVALRMLRSLALRGRRAREAPVAPGATTWRRRGTLARGPGAIAARARPCGARRGSGPWRCSGWRQRRMSPPGASGRYPTSECARARRGVQTRAWPGSEGTVRGGGEVGGPAPQRRPWFPGHAAVRRRRQATLRALCRTKLRAREWQLLVARRSGASLRLGTLEPMTR